LTREPHSQPLRAGALAAATVAVGLAVTQSGPITAQSKQFAIRGIGITKLDLGTKVVNTLAVACITPGTNQFVDCLPRKPRGPHDTLFETRPTAVRCDTGRKLAAIDGQRSGWRSGAAQPDRPPCLPILDDTEPSISRDQILRVLRRRWWIVAQLVLVGLAVGVLLARAAPTRYEATATALIESAAGGAASNTSTPGSLSAAAAARLIRTRSVAEQVGRALDDKRSAGELLDAVTAKPDSSGAFVNVTARDATAAGAANLANAFAQQFITARGTRIAARVQRSITAAQGRLARLPLGSERTRIRAEIADLRATAASGAIAAEVIDPAVPGANERTGALVRWTAIGGGLGLLVGFVLVFSLQALDPRVRALDEMRGLVRAPQLAAIPARRRRWRRAKRPPVLTARTEPFEHLRSALLVLNGDRKLPRIVVTSPRDRADGKTVVAANLAVSLTRLGLRVCAVDADLRQPALASEFGLEDTAVGLADALRGAPLHEATQRFAVPSEDHGNGSGPPPSSELSVISGGTNTTNAAALLAGGRMQEILEELARNHDVVILDCAPLLALSDALPLLERTSGTILVARHSHTQRRAVVRAARMVADVQGSLLGIVTTGVPRGELAAEGSGPWPGSAP